MNDQRSQFRRLRAEYDVSFRRWEDEVRSLELLTSQPGADSKAIERAQRRVAEAQDAYRESRNLLAKFLVTALGISSDHSPSEPASAAPNSANTGTSQVGRLNQILETAREHSSLDEADLHAAQLIR